MSVQGYPHKPNLMWPQIMTGRPIPPAVMFAFHQMVTPMNYNWYSMQVYGQEVGEARNNCVENALQNECKYIFFWDEDVACPPHSIPELVYKLEHNSHIGVAGGVYCLKREPAEPLVFRGNGNGPYWDWRAGEFFEVSGIGMGCTLIRMEVFKDLKRPWFKTVQNYERMLDGIAGLETWTEDLYFCHRLTESTKWKIYADGSLLCTHHDMAFPCKGWKLPEDSKPVQHLKTNGKSRILDIGSGRTPYQTPDGTTVTADQDERARPDYRCDLRKLPFGEKEFDIVFSQALDQFDSHETHEVLDEWTRVLRTPGEIRLVSRNMEWAARQVANGDVTPSALFDGKRKTAFTYEQLDSLLKPMGFKTEKVKSDAGHIAIRGRWQHERLER